MRVDRGVTLTSLMIYVIGMIIVISIIATFTSFFYKNVNIEDLNVDTTQYTEFSGVFLKEINKSGNYVVDFKPLSDDGVSYVVFASGNQFTFVRDSQAVYRNKIKVCGDVELCDFDVSFVDSRFVVGVEFKSGSVDLRGENAVQYSCGR